MFLKKHKRFLISIISKSTQGISKRGLCHETFPERYALSDDTERSITCTEMAQELAIYSTVHEMGIAHLYTYGVTRELHEMG